MHWIVFLAQAETPAPTPATGAGLVGVALVASLIVAMLPVLAGYISHRSIHQLLALIFCIASFALFGFGTTLSWIGGAFLMPVSAGLWLVGLLFGLASSIDSMAVSRERRERRRLEKVTRRAQPPQRQQPDEFEPYQPAPFHVKR